MKKRNKKSWKIKSILGLGVLAPSAAVLATVVSCSPLLGGLGRYDSDTDNVVVIQTTWSSSGKQIAALEKVIDKYNEENKGTPNFMQVQVEKVEGGYGTIPSQLLTKIQSQDKKTLPNLYIDYPSAVGMIAPYDMLVNVGGQNGLKRDIFEEKFVRVNDQIAGVPTNGIYSVPLAKSTEGVTLDRPLLKYIFTQMQTAGFTIENNDENPTIKSIMSVDLTVDDEAQIKKNWGLLDKSKVLPDGKYNFINGNREGATGDQPNNKIINDAIFTNFNSLMTFVKVTQGFFPNTSGGKILGLDSPSNTAYILSALAAKNDKEHFLFSKNKSSNNIDYNFLKDGSTEATTFRNIYENYFQQPINKGGLWVGGGGAYGTENLKSHAMAISIGSSAGLDKSFDYKHKGYLSDKEVGYHLPINKIYSNDSRPSGSQYDWDKTTSVVSQGPSINTVHISSAEDASSIKFLKWLYSKEKVDFGSGEIHTPTEMFALDSSYVVPTKGAFDSNSPLAQKIAGKSFTDLVTNYNLRNLLGLKMTIDTISRQLELDKKSENNADIFDVPVGVDTGAIRSIIESKIKGSSGAKEAGSAAYTPLRAWSEIRDQAIIDGIISGSVDKKEYNWPSQLNRNYSDIDWSYYNYVDAEIIDWTDGDTPNVTVKSVHSKTDALKGITTGSRLSIRISGIDTPEAHVKLGDLKRLEDVDGTAIAKGLSNEWINGVINKYKTAGNPLAVFSRGHYNELNNKYDPLNPDRNLGYGYWKNLYTDIQTPNLNLPNKAFDKIDTDANHPDATYNFRTALYDNKGFMSPSVLIEGYWGWRAGDFGRKVMPKGTKIRIATDGKKSYNRIVGSIFYDSDHARSVQRAAQGLSQVLNSSYSVNITRAGLTLPFVSNPGSIMEPHNIMWEVGPGIADAFNYAISHPTLDDRKNDNPADKILFEYAQSTAGKNDPNGTNTLFNYRRAVSFKKYVPGQPDSTASETKSSEFDSLADWLSKALITHGVTNYSTLLKNGGSGSIYNYLRYRNPDKGNLKMEEN